MAKRDVPRPFAYLRRGRDNKVKTVRQLFENDDWAREQFTFTVYLRSDILAEADPPNISLRYQRRPVPDVVQPLLQTDPREKLLHHMRYDSTAV